MTTVKQIERLWTGQRFEHLFRDLTAARAEGGFGVAYESGWAVPAAAMALIRLDELTQSHTPCYATLLRKLLAAQQADGGWGDLPTTALCLRALLCGNGHGAAIERGMSYLANLQKSDGIWPRVPFRRMPEDAHVSAFVLYELGDQPAFRAAVRLDDVITWYERQSDALTADLHALWQQALRRCRTVASSPYLAVAAQWS